MQRDSPVSLDVVATQDNDLGADGAEALRPALEKLEKLTLLNLTGTCGDAQRRSKQCEQCARVREAGQAVVMGRDGLFACEVRGVWLVR